jgi:hypothetical protein
MTSRKTPPDGPVTPVVNPGHDRRRQGNDTSRLLGIGGSLRPGSCNLRLLLAAQELPSARAGLIILERSAHHAGRRDRGKSQLLRCRRMGASRDTQGPSRQPART